ncbi:MAG TPA: methionine--tRNA ligase subunit beta [Candidatus Omnitrophota bacterium]|nr:methionine--tRNA ligase subunit beta [Candidatus Omnitrophota bacterium]
MVSYEDFKKLDLRVAEIKSVREHPNADKLLVLDVVIGEETKQIVAGIKAAYSKEELVGRKVIVLNNLEPAVLRGEVSSGMLLAASHDGSLPVLLSLEKEVPSGAVVK